MNSRLTKAAHNLYHIQNSNALDYRYACPLCLRVPLTVLQTAEQLHARMDCEHRCVSDQSCDCC